MDSQSGSSDSFPKGTILPYTGLLSNIPSGWHLCDGTDDTPNLIGQFLQGSNSPGNFIEPAIPNIKGDTASTSELGINYGITGNGAIRMEPYGVANYSYPASPGNILYFDASRYNSIYKDDCNTVQPPAYTVYYIIKMA